MKQLRQIIPPVLYGSEYFYQTTIDGRVTSSGVATNEPGSIREENILVDFVASKRQKIWSRIVAGTDKEQAEGPLGESILPGASVGYSRVIVRSIHSGLSNPGFSINEFHTAQSDPIILAHPDRDGTMTTVVPNNDKPENKILPLYTKIKNRTRVTQGFSFVLNNMHGQPRKVAMYSGRYDALLDKIDGIRVGETSYEYFKNGEKVPMMSSLYGGVTMKNPGREVDLTFAQRSVSEKTNDFNLEVDLQVAVMIFAVIPYPTGVPTFSSIEGELNTHSITKVVRYPAIVKSTTITQEGITHTQENLAFDEFTGKPVAVRSSDEFNGAYLAQSIPASWQYPEMAGKWLNQDKKYTGPFTVTNGHIAVNTGTCTLADFALGDKIGLKNNSDTAPTVVYYVTALDWINNWLIVEKASSANSATGSYQQLTIIRSGHTNQLQQQAGSITTHNEVKSSATPLVVSQVDRYGTNSFADAWNAQLTILKDTPPPIPEFTLVGPFTEMNMSGFASLLTQCNIDLTNAKVKDLEYRYKFQGNAFVFELMAFKIDCLGNDTYTTEIKTEGWQ